MNWIKMKKQILKTALLLFSFICTIQTALAWDLHTLIAQPIFSSMDEVIMQDSVKVTSLEDFLIAVETDLSKTLAREEQWAIENLVDYKPCPSGLLFQVTETPEDIRNRFMEAIRINPESKLIPYLQLIPGRQPGDRTVLAPEAITPLKQNSSLQNVLFVGLTPGELIDPLSVLVTANDEPDMGLDIGLYEDNGTDAGKAYGFGVQPFGNPNLEYGSQAPFHMGLYHEANIINTLAPYIKEGYPEYRIHLFKTLSELAFRNGQDYWGWRFMGWGLHYIADLTQPYHACALPGVSPAKMILMNTLNMVGLEKSKNNAVQLVSNRHTAIESLERQLLERAYLENALDYLQIESLGAHIDAPTYDDNFPRSVIAKQSHGQAIKLDKIIAEYFPNKLVSDPEFELGSSSEQKQILELVNSSDNPEAIVLLENQVNDLLQLFSLYSRSYTLSILAKN